MQSSSVTSETAGAWIGLIGAALGALFALFGVAIGELGQNRRAKRLERDAADAQREARRIELWDISRPAAGRIQEFFGNVGRLARFDPEDELEPRVSFDDGFPNWWWDHSIELKRDIALIPSSELRLKLRTVIEAMDVGYDLARLTNYARGYQHAVSRMSSLGFDIASSWLRDEPDLDLATEQQFEALRSALYDADNRNFEEYQNKKSEKSKKRKAKGKS